MSRVFIRRASAAFVTALVLALFVIRPAADAQRRGAHRMPSCADTDFTAPRLFDVMPIDLSTVMGIVPLGSVSPPSHIVPVAVVYFYTPYTLGTDGREIIPNVTDQPILVPGDVTVTGLRWEKNSGGELIAGDDWYVNFKPCDEIRFTYHHLNAITGPPRLVARARQIRRGVNAVCDYDASGEPVACTGLADVPMSAGDEIGTVFRLNQAGFNFSVLDRRDPSANPPAPPGMAVDPTRYDLTYEQILAWLSAAGQEIPREFTPELYDEMDPSRTQARCALHYFEPALRSAFEALLGSFDGTTRRTVPPLCGQFFQDSLSGGLRGGWFPEDLTTPFLLGSEGIALGFLYGNVLPGRMYISIGGNVVPAVRRTLSFPYFGDDPTTWRNTSFIGARYQPALPPDAQPLYCWEGLGEVTMIGGATSGSSPFPGVVLVQFESPTRIRFDYVETQTCATRAFTSSAQVFVR